MITCGALLLLLAAAVHTAAASESSGFSGESERNCPKFWVDGTFVGMGCFKFDTTGKMTQDAAVQYCQGVENATLIEIHNQEQKDFFVMERDVIEAEGGRKTWWLGDFVWWQTQPNGGLSENCMYTTVDS